MHLLHRITKLHAEPRENVALPRVVLGVHARLHLLVIDDAHPELLLSLRRVERRARTLDLRQELLPERERVAQPVEHVFRFEVPEGLELQPFGDVVFQLLHLALYECERALQRIVREARELEEGVGDRVKRQSGINFFYSPRRCTILPMMCFLAFAVRFHISNFESVVAGRSHLEGRRLVNTKSPSA